MRHILAKSVALLFVLILCLTEAAVAHAQATDLHDAAGQLTKRLHDDPDVQKISGEHIAIAPFENDNGMGKWHPKGDSIPRLSYLLFSRFVAAAPQRVDTQH